MTRIVVLSDIHSNTVPLKKISGILTESDYVIFLGDGINSIYPYKNLLGDRLIMVKGNCDMFSQAGDEVVMDIDGHKLLITHGHKYHVKESLNDLIYRANEVNADLVLYGHTHIPYMETINGCTLVNPGSLGLPRMGHPTYAYIVLMERKPMIKIVEVW
ncbi:MAG TPA: metallophosphoesterase [Clostridia bacterium]